MSGKARKGSKWSDLSEDGSRLMGQAVQFIRYCHKWEASQGSEYHIRSISLYPPSATKAGMWMVIAKAWYGGYKMVAFHRSSDPFTALVGLLQRWLEGKLDWKRDQYGD